MIYVVSDLHFNHDREFIWKPRGFKSCQEMNDTLFRSWNNKITNKDDVWVIGDFFLGQDNDFIRKTLSKLKGHIHLIAGNHDTPAKIKIYEEFGIDWYDAKRFIYNGRKFYLSHYPTHTSDLNGNPATAEYCLSGHTHNKEKFYEGRPYIYNVAVDAHRNNGFITSMDEVMTDIDNEIKDCIRFLV